MISRSKLLEAAARVYAECGFRGATTRRIAEEAGVNEVTIFRNFGSKAALIHEAVQCHAGPALALPPLPDVPVDPERELLAWAEAHFAHLRDAAPLIRKTMGELEERPEGAPVLSSGAEKRATALRRYLLALQRHGWLDGDRPCSPHELHGAAAMLMGTVFADAMGRDMVPGLFPQPERRAVAMYVRILLRSIGFRERGAAAELHSLHGKSTRHP